MFVSEGAAGVLQLQRCNGPNLSQQLITINDQTPDSALRAGVAAVRQIMRNRYRPLYVEFHGTVNAKGATANQFQRAIGFVESCKTMPGDIASNVRLHAIGQDPPWRLIATDAGARLELSGKEAARFSGAPFKSPASNEQNVRRYEAKSAGDGGLIRVELTEQMCSDGRSETAYGARAVVRFGNRTLEGCAARF